MNSKTILELLAMAYITALALFMAGLIYASLRTLIERQRTRAFLRNKSVINPDDLRDDIQLVCSLSQPGVITMNDPVQLEIVCAWCGIHISGPVGALRSHGICPECRDEYIARAELQPQTK